MSRYLELSEELSGKRFGKLTVLWRDNDQDNHPAMKPWFCECDCGKTTYASKWELENGTVISCGCVKPPEKEKRVPYTIVNGHRKRLYIIWCSMKRRCYNPSRKDYHSYGGRGITICDEWRDNYLVFEKWALEHGYADDLSIDRIDNDGNYCPENCRWATRKEQDHNRPGVHLYYLDDKEYTLFELGAEYQVDPKSIKLRLKRGMPLQEAVADSIAHRRKPWDAVKYKDDKNKRKRRYNIQKKQCDNTNDK